MMLPSTLALLGALSGTAHAEESPVPWSYVVFDDLSPVDVSTTAVPDTDERCAFAVYVRTDGRVADARTDDCSVEAYVLEEVLAWTFEVREQPAMTLVWVVYDAGQSSLQPWTFGLAEPVLPAAWFIGIDGGVLEGSEASSFFNHEGKLVARFESGRRGQLGSASNPLLMHHSEVAIKRQVPIKAPGGATSCLAVVHLNDRGKPVEVRAETECDDVHARAVEAGLRRWRWSPPVHDGVPVHATVRVRVKFT